MALPPDSSGRKHIWMSCRLAFHLREIHTWRWHTSHAERHGPFLGGTSLYRDVIDRPRRRLKERKDEGRKQQLCLNGYVSPELKNVICMATQIRDSHTGHTHSWCKPSYFHAKQRWSKTLGRRSLAEECGQEGGEKLEQKCKMLLWWSVFSSCIR